MNRTFVPVIALGALLFAFACSDDPNQLAEGTKDAGKDTSVVPGSDTGPGDANPKPVLAAIAPTSALVGSVGPTLVLTGDGFSPTSEARVEGVKLQTTYFAVNELRASLPNNILEKAGTLHVIVSTPAPGGGDSVARNFEVQNPKPTAERLSPVSAASGSADLPITVLGTGFADGATVMLDGTALTTLSGSPTSITAVIPAKVLVSPGSRSVLVQNPPPNEKVPDGAVSETLAFIVENPGSVQVASISPSFAYVGDGPIDVTVSGTGFVANASVSFNGTPLTVKSVTATTIVATIPQAQLSSSLSVPVVVTTPPPGGGVSTPRLFDIRNPVPVLSTVSPNKITYGAGDQTLNLKGTGFAKGASVKFGSLLLSTTFVSSTELNAALPSVGLTSVGSFAVTVTNPAIVGGTSAAVNVDVACTSTGVDRAFNGPAAAVTLSLNWPTTKYGRLSASSCPATASTSTTMPQLGWVVQNTSASPIVISAWGVCKVVGSAQDDLILAFYPYDHVPTSAAERASCTRIAEGKPLSPEAGGSKWCQGLTKANAAGMTLKACEKGVVLAQPYDPNSTTFPSPAAIRIQAEAP